MSNKRHPSVVNKFSWLIAAALAFCAQLPAHAQSGPRSEMALDWRERHAPNGELTAYDSTLLGDAIDLSSGRLSFEHVDVSLPGNFNLPVEMRRRLNPSQMQSGEFADWQLAIPTISTKILSDEWFASPSRKWGKTRCSGTLTSALPNASWPTRFPGGTALPPYKWSDGVILDVPGRIQGQVLDKTVTSGWPTSAKKVTADGWYLECLTNIDGAGTEGFVAVAPNGDRYTFDVLMNPGSRKADFDIWQLDANFPVVSAVHWIKMGVYYDVLSVSQVTDVNGNWVQYTYDANKRLQSITSSDGRRIDIGRTGNQIGTVTANSGTASARQWTYSYGWKNVTTFKPPSSINGLGGSQTEMWGTLTAVTLPNGRQWQFDLGGLQARAVPGTSYSGTTCKQFNQTVSLTHPDGVTGTFTIEEVLLRLGAGATGSTGPYCPNSSLGSMGSSQLTDVIAVTHKTLASPSMPTATWDYSYYDTGSETQVTIHQPDDSKRIEYHPTPYTFATARVHAKLTKEELYPTMASSTPIEVKTYSYVQEPAAGSNFIPNSVQDTYAPVRLSDTAITRGSDIYNTHAVFNSDRTSATYSYGFPTSVQQWSNVGGGTRQIDTVYAHNTSLWILGLPSTITKNSKLFDSFTYDSLGRLWKQYRFGDLWKTYSYHTATGAIGAPYSIADGLATPRTAYFRNWKGGLPQEVERPDGYKLYRTIDDNGWVTSIADWKGNTTGFGYDLMGRLTLIDRPSPWSDTNIGYSYASGSLIQTITRGTEQVSITHDAMLRPTQKVQQALSGGGGSIYVSNNYNAMGKAVFTSLPAAAAGSTFGTSTTYDVLGRVLTKVNTATGASSSYAYPAGNKITMTDPLSNVMTTTLSGFGNPNDGNVISMVMPEGISTTKSYDLYGNLTGISQNKGGGTTLNSAFYYDGHLRLCRKSIPETGDTLYAYNSADELTSYSEGQSIGTNCQTPPAGASVVQTYDLDGRLTYTDYPNSTPDISRTYDNNNNLLTISRGGANWVYTYDTADLPTSETLSIDGLTYAVTNIYDADEKLAQKTFPSGTPYYYTTNGLNQVTAIQGNGTNYVSNTSWSPSGKIRLLTQGNGNVFDQQLDNAQRVRYIGNTYGDSLTYSFDLDDRITQITATTSSAYSRTFGYDGVSRLTTAGGPWGSASFVYDPLGNITNKILGSRVVDVTYDTLNRVSQVRDTGVSANWRTYSYDSRGNTAADGIRVFTHDDANQPTSISGLGAANYQYDGNLKRVKEIGSGSSIYSIYDRSGALITRHNVSTGAKTDYLSLAGQTFARVTNGVATYPINDHLGTALWVAAQNGNIPASQTYNYGPFGEVLAGSGVGRSGEQGYTGHIEDASGLTYMQARYYDPVMGRFLEADPSGYEDGLNVYGYVANDPINKHDPNGLEGHSGFEPGAEGFNYKWSFEHPDVGHGVRFDETAKAATSARGVFVMGAHGGAMPPRLPYMNGYANGKTFAYYGAKMQLYYMTSNGYKGNMPIIAAWCNSDAAGNGKQLAQLSKNMVIATTGHVDYHDVDSNGTVTMTATANDDGTGGPGTFTAYMPNGDSIPGITSITIDTKTGTTTFTGGTATIPIATVAPAPAPVPVCGPNGGCK